MSVISVILGTADGRKTDLERCEYAYSHRTGSHVEMLIAHNLPSCADAWNEGAAKANGDFLHFTNDDIEPRPGWDEPAIIRVREGTIPAPGMYTSAEASRRGCEDEPHVGEGAPCKRCVLPFCSREQRDAIGPFPKDADLDAWFSARASSFGWLTLFTPGYGFTNYHASP